MVLSNDEISKLHTIRKTVMEMLHDRGYEVTELEINMSREDFMNIHGESMTRKHLEIQRGKRNDPADQIYVFCFPEEDVKVNMIKEYVERLRSVNALSAVIVIPESKKLSSHAKSAIDGVARWYHIQHFQDGELMCNVTKHQLVPKHEPITEEEKKSLLEKYSVQENQLPKIEVSDPVAKYHGVKPGQVMRITRTLNDNKKTNAYRLVVPDENESDAG